MYERKIDCLVVVRGEQLVGILTAIDVMRSFVELFGMGEHTVRVEVLMSNRPGELSRVVRAVGVDLREQMTLCDAGDVFTIPANIEKTFDQISRAVSHVFSSGALPIMLGGDHSIGFPCVRGIAECTSKRIGIIHFDRHIDIQEKDLDERMHTTPWFWATNLPNVPAALASIESSWRSRPGSPGFSKYASLPGGPSKISTRSLTSASRKSESFIMIVNPSIRHT